MSRCCRFALACWLVCCLGLAAATARAVEMVAIDRVEQYLDLTPWVEMLEDGAAALTPEQVLLQPGWQSATHRRLNLGVTEAAVWLRLRVENRSGKPLERWLTLGSSRLEQVDYYRLVPGVATPVEAAVSGLAHALERRPEAGLISIFPLRLEPGASATLLLRASGRTRMMLEPALWEPLAYRAQESDLTVRQLVPLCALLGVALCMLVHGLARQDRSLLLLAAWLFLMALYAFAYGGHLYRFVFHQGGEPAVRAMVLLSHLCIVLCASFTLLFLRLYPQRGWRVVYLLFIGASLLLALQSAFGDLRPVNVMTIPLLGAFFVIWPVSILWAWHRGVANAGLFWFASCGLCFTIILRLAEQLGWLAADVLPAESLTMRPALVLVLALVMAFGMLRGSLAEQRVYRAAQAALFKSRQGEQTRLEALVREHTQTLQDAVMVADEARRARSELLARVNHDLRRPAAEIIELVTPLLQQGGKQQAYGAVIRRSATHLQGLIDDLIDEAGAGSPLGGIKPEPVDIRSLLEGLAAEAEGLAGAGGNAFVFSLGSGLPPQLLVDAKRLRQVLINLLDNAAKFTRGGRIEFRVEAITSPATAMLSFTVSDTGVGMSAEQLVVVFEPYRRAESSCSQPGLGLGLAIARHWVERMEGQILVDSEPGQGTKMKVVLPLGLPVPASGPAPLVEEAAISDAPNAVDNMGTGRPDATTLAEAADLLRMGALSDLLDWSAILLARQPECRRFAERMAALAEGGDLRGLAALLESRATLPDQCQREMRSPERC